MTPSNNKHLNRVIIQIQNVMPSNSRIDLNHLTSYLHTTNSDCTTYKLIASSFATCITSRSSIVVVCITLSITIFYADRFKSARTSFNILLGLHGRPMAAFGVWASHPYLQQRLYQEHLAISLHGYILFSIFLLNPRKYHRSTFQTFDDGGL